MTSSQFNHHHKRKLYKLPDQAKICGVCAGVAEYFGFEIWLVRIIAISLLLLTGLSGAVVLAYFVLCFLLDPKPGSKNTNRLFGRRVNPSESASQGSDDGTNASKPYQSSIKDVWKAGTSPAEALKTIEDKLQCAEQKLQSLERFVTSNQFELEEKFKDLHAE